MGVLVLMRHAKSDYPVGVPDHDRPLAPRGRREAPLMAPLLEAELAGSSRVAVLVSTAVRAQETWAAVEAHLSLPVTVDAMAGLYESDPATIGRYVHEVSDVDAVIVVAHNPGLEQAVADWVGVPVERFPTSAFAVLECEEAWDAFEHAPVRMRAFHIAR